jgi:hypothetical protein
MKKIETFNIQPRTPNIEVNFKWLDSFQPGAWFSVES